MNSSNFTQWKLKQQSNITGYLGWYHKWKLKVNGNINLLTFEEYLFKAYEAGLVHPNQIGHSTDKYNLSRFGDKGDYTNDNCRFLTTKENHKERDYSFLSDPALDRATHMIGNTHLLNHKHSIDSRISISKSLLGNTNTDNKGEKHGRTKLLNNQVIEIWYDKRDNRLIAEEYDISTQIVSRIKSKERWLSVTKDLPQYKE